MMEMADFQVVFFIFLYIYYDFNYAELMYSTPQYYSVIETDKFVFFVFKRPYVMYGTMQGKIYLLQFTRIVCGL